MIRALAGVFLHPPAELAEGHQHHVVGPPEPRHVLDEGRDVIGRVGPQPRVHVALVDVGVEGVVAVRDIIDLGREIGGDKRGQQSAADTVLVLSCPELDGLALRRLLLRP